MSTYQLPRQYFKCRSVEILKDTDIEKNDRTIKIYASDETPVRQFSWEDWEEYDLIVSHQEEHVNFERVNNGVCMFFENHPGMFSRSKRLGKVKSAKIEDKKLILTIKLNRSEDANNYLRDLEDGTEPGNSIGFDVHKMEVVKKAVYEDTDNKGYRKLVKPALMKAIDWELFEVSAVDIPANPNTGNQQLSEKIPVHPVEVIGEFPMSGINSNSEKTDSTSDTNDELIKLKFDLVNAKSELYRERLKNSYLILRNNGYAELTQNTLTHDNFQKFFSGNVNEDLTKLSKMSDEDLKIELKVLERSLLYAIQNPAERLSESEKILLQNQRISQQQPDGIVTRAQNQALGLGSLSVDETAKLLMEGL